MHKCVNNSPANVYHLEQMVDNFFPYSQKQLGFDQPVTVVFQGDEDNSLKMLGKTAFYDPEAHSVTLYIDGRHPKDVMRSLSHELVHHAQNCRGDFQSSCEKEGWNQACVKDMGPGYAQKDPHLRNMEREAYTKGNLIFRDFEDLIKTGKIKINIDFNNSGEPKMSLKESRNYNFNRNLMKKWGFLNESKEEAADTAEVTEVTEATEAEDVTEVAEPEEVVESEKTADLTEESGEEEAWHQWKNEHADDDHIREIEHHLRALKDDRDHERGEAEYDHDKYEDEGDRDLEEGDVAYRDDDKKELEQEAMGRGEHYKGVGSRQSVNQRGNKFSEKGALEKKKLAELKNRKISVREAKELTQRIMERIKEEIK